MINTEDTSNGPKRKWAARGGHDEGGSTPEHQKATQLDNRIGKAHGKILKTLSQDTYTSSSKIGEEGIPLNKVGTQGKRVPNIAPSAKDKAAGKKMVELFNSTFPPPYHHSVANETPAERKSRMTRICHEYIERGVGNISISDFDSHCAVSEERLLRYHQLTPENGKPLPKEQLRDFIETLSDNASGFRRTMNVPQGSNLKKHPEIFIRSGKGAGGGGSGWSECPIISKTNDMKFSGKIDYHPCISTMTEVVHDNGGAVVLSRSGHIAGIRADPSFNLTEVERNEFARIVRGCKNTTAYLKRKESVLNVSVDFQAFGMKAHRDVEASNGYALAGARRVVGSGSKAKVIPQINKDLAKSVSTYHAMRAFACDVIEPKLMRLLYLEMMALKLFILDQSIVPWNDVFCGCTVGTFFWPTSHFDLDLWWTGLICVDTVENGVLGGDWSFPDSGKFRLHILMIIWLLILNLKKKKKNLSNHSTTTPLSQTELILLHSVSYILHFFCFFLLGHVLKAFNGSFFAYGGWEHHSTTKMNINQQLAYRNPVRMYGAFYNKYSVLRAVSCSRACGERHSAAKNNSTSKMEDYTPE
jgi:hypothetical protein